MIDNFSWKKKVIAELIKQGQAHRDKINKEIYEWRLANPDKVLD